MTTEGRRIFDVLSGFRENRGAWSPLADHARRRAGGYLGKREWSVPVEPRWCGDEEAATRTLHATISNRGRIARPGAGSGPFRAAGRPARGLRLHRPRPEATPGRIRA